MLHKYGAQHSLSSVDLSTKLSIASVALNHSIDSKRCHCIVLLSPHHSASRSLVLYTHIHEWLAFLASFDLIISASRKCSATFYHRLRILFWAIDKCLRAKTKIFHSSDSSARRERFQNFRATLRSLDHAATKNGLWTSDEE